MTVHQEAARPGTPGPAARRADTVLEGARHRPPRARAAVSVIAVLAILVGSARVAAMGFRGLATGHRADPGAVLTGVLSAGLALVLVALAALLFLALLAMLSDRVPAVIVPRLALRAAAVLLGVSVVTTPAARASTPAPLPTPGFQVTTSQVAPSSPAAPGSAPDGAATKSRAPHESRAPHDRPVTDLPRPGFVATRPAERRQPDATLLTPPLRRPTTGGPPTRTVVRGDTLWGIAADTLSESATDTQIAAAVHAWHRANLDVIGPDPDALLPGQVLAAPGHQDRWTR